LPIAIPFRRDLDFSYGEVRHLSPLVRRVIAENPSLFTFHGTGTYIVGRGDVAIIDPGPALESHVAALLDAIKDESVSHILITHTHRDHSPAAAAIKQATGAKTYAFGPHPSSTDVRVEEGGDHDFVPDIEVPHGGVIEGHGWTFEALHTPGHLSNHLCFALREENALFSGDHVMGWSTSVVSPPEGDMGAYFASLRLVLERSEQIFYPTHGAPVAEPKPLVAALLAHREEREQQILECLKDAAKTIPEMVAVIYRDVDRRLHGAAGRSVLAHLLHLAETRQVRAEGETPESTRYRLL
jgi:glyoxylase-like metal-dependent hydrolase (beta-lactamase superfamily II)